VGRRRFVIVALCALFVIAGGWALLRTSGPATKTAGVPTCPLATLPRGVADTVREIRSNGPFPFPHNDGVVFSNFEGRLPGQGRGYYTSTPSSPGRPKPVDEAHHHRWISVDQSAPVLLHRRPL